MRVVSLAVLLALGLVGCKGGSTMDDQANKNNSGKTGLDNNGVVVDDSDVPDGLKFLRNQLDVTPSCSTQMEKNKTLLAYLKKSYYWNQDLPEELDNSYANKSMSDALASIIAYKNSKTALAKDKDNFSALVDYSTFKKSDIDGLKGGYGIDFQMSNTGDELLVRQIFPGSPADGKLVRGDKITHIQGKTISQIVGELKKMKGYQDSLKAYFIRGWVNKLNHMNIQWKDVSDSEKVGNLARTDYEIKTVFKTQLLEVNESGEKTGYLVFNAFESVSESELESAFAIFRGQEIESLILDLRYNGGGSVAIANQLISQIAGQLKGKPSFSSTYNKEVTSVFENINYPTNGKFGTTHTTLDTVKKLVVLTSSSTCSASELVINALRAYPSDIEVITVGSKSCGKPFGMIPQFMCSSVVYAINSRIVNANNEENYANTGFAPSCKYSDHSIHADWGVSGEKGDPLLNAAIYRLENGSCPAESSIRTLESEPHTTLTIPKMTMDYRF